MSEARRRGDAAARDPNESPDERPRIDKWLWAARFYKTRSLAAEAVSGGHVEVEGQRVKPARLVRVGERLSIQRGEIRVELWVRALSERRGPASVAQTLYEETPQSQAARANQQEQRRYYREPGAEAGRPTKRDRREREKWRE